MGLFSRRRPDVRRLTRKGDVAGLVAALEHTDQVLDRGGRRVDVGASVRRDAAEALGDHDDPLVVRGLVGRLSDENEAVRLAAIRALRWRPEDDVVLALAGGVGSWPSPEGDGSRAEALDALLEIRDPRTLELLVVSIVQRASDRPLGPSDASSLTAVLEMNGDDAGRVAWRLVPPLGHERMEVQDRAETVLTWLGSPSVEPLIAALERPDVRRRAAKVLGELRDSRAVEPLVEMAFDHEVVVRRTVAGSLGLIKDPSAAPVLLRSSRDTDYGVRDAALRALNELGAAAVVLAVAQLQQSLIAGDEHRMLELGEAPGEPDAAASPELEFTASPEPELGHGHEASAPDPGPRGYGPE